MGDTALRIEIPDGMDHAAVFEALRSLPGVVDAVVAERHALVTFAGEPVDPRPALQGLAGRHVEPRLFEIPVRYDGPDLETVARTCGLPVDEVIGIHSGSEYAVRLIGFLPGFAYLGDLDPRIAAPRLKTPRVRVPAGAVAIAGVRTAVYPFASPGGWNLIGTAIDFPLFDPASGARLQLGDRVRFVRG